MCSRNSLAACIFLLGLSALGGLEGCTAAKHKGKGRVHDEEHGFSIVPPAGWISRGEFMGNFMTFTGPQEGGFTVNFNVNVQDHDRSPIEQVPAQVKLVYRKMLTDLVIADERFVTIDKKKCYCISSRFRMGTDRLQNLQYFLVGGNRKKIYIMTFTAPADSFAEYRPLFERTALTARTD